MSGGRCFSNPTKCETSSDYTKSTKQKTIFKDVVNQVQGQTNFIKNNGVNYNENFGLHNQCLAFAKSYDLLLDVTKGNYYTKPVEDPNWVSNEAWSAGLYSVDYSANNVKTVVDTSYNAGNGNHIIFPMTQSAELADISWNGLYPGVVVDPSYTIFYNECEDQNYWREKLVDMSFNATNYYIQSKKQSEKLYGMRYPSNVTFSCGINCIYSWKKGPANDTTGGTLSNNWTSITSNSDGSRLAACVTGFPGGRLFTSSDFGASWVKGPATGTTGGSLTQPWSKITSNNTGSRLAACALSGVIYTSSDFGASWVKGPATDTTGGSTTQTWNSITSNSDGSRLVIGGGNTLIYTSSDFGVSWVKGPSTDTTGGSLSQNWLSITSNDTGSKLVIGGGNTLIYTSSDFGVSWVKGPSTDTTGGSLSQVWNSITSNNTGSRLAACDGGSIYTSSDFGISWVKGPATDTTGGSLTQAWLSIISNDSGSVLTICGPNTLIYTSSDFGVSWVKGPSTDTTGGSLTQNWREITSDKSGCVLALIGFTPTPSIYTTTN
jgi:hypothetical protein